MHLSFEGLQVAANGRAQATADDGPQERSLEPGRRGVARSQRRVSLARMPVAAPGHLPWEYSWKPAHYFPALRSPPQGLPRLPVSLIRVRDLRRLGSADHAGEDTAWNIGPAVRQASRSRARRDRTAEASMRVQRIIMTTITTPSQTATDAAVGPAICPLCHTPEPRMTHVALRAGGSWRCSVCDQMWSAQRLATVAAYAAFAARHDAASRPAHASTP